MSPSEADCSKGVYIYHPAKQPIPGNDWPKKRRKVDKMDDGTSECIFVPLLNGDEGPASVNLRYRTYEHLLSAQEAKIQVSMGLRIIMAGISNYTQKVLDDVDSEVLDNVSSFIRTASPETYVYDDHSMSEANWHRYNGCIPTALVTVGSNVSSLGRLLHRLHDKLTAAEVGGVVVLESGDAPNLKSALKNIIRAAITSTEGNDGYQSLLNGRDVRSDCTSLCSIADSGIH